MTRYNDNDGLSQQIADLRRQIMALATQPRAISTSIDRGGTQSSDYNGSGINSPGTQGWKIGTDETTGIGYIHINGRTTPARLAWEKAPFENSWTNYGGQFHNAGYTVTRAGIVCLTGLITGGTADLPAFTLPAAYRPEYYHLVPTVSNDVLGIVRVRTNGSVVPSAAWCSLGGIMFPAAGAGTWTNVTTFENGFSSYHVTDPTYPPLGYMRDIYGRVWFRGLLARSSAITADITAFTLPGDYLPAGNFIHLPGVSNGGFASYDIRPYAGSTAFTVKNGTTGTAWMSLDKCAYVCESYYPFSTMPKLRMTMGDWTNYGSTYPNAHMATFPDGMVMMGGLINAGSVGSGGRILSTPEGLSPDNSYGFLDQGSDIYLLNANNATARSDLTRSHPVTAPAPGSHLIPNTGSNVWRSLNGLNYLIGS